VELDPDHDGAWTARGYLYETKRSWPSINPN
jgi:hypothetical protein